jgi:hypothetical protein
MLELAADGRFHYGLSYGALDEEARGQWAFDGARVLLTSDAVVAPRFVVVSARPLRVRRLKLTLDVPGGMNRQYFKALVTLADGRTFERQFADDGLELALEPRDRPVSVALRLPVFALQGDAVRLPAGPGAEVHLRFDPNDLGKVAFEGEPLAVQGGSLLLERQGRMITFRRAGEE